jgi:trimeric autotransporter adhesin
MADNEETAAAASAAAAAAAMTGTHDVSVAAAAAAAAGIVSHPGASSGVMPAAGILDAPLGGAASAADEAAASLDAAAAHLAAAGEPSLGKEPVGAGAAMRKRGRPPNINENSLIRRLECVLLVESGRVPLKDACQRYDISPRTFYRWLSSKERLISLTGHDATTVAKLQEVIIARMDDSEAAAGDGPADLAASRKRTALAAFAAPGLSAAAADYSDKRRMPAVAPGTAASMPLTAGEKRRLPVSRMNRQNPALAKEAAAARMSPQTSKLVAGAGGVATPVGSTLGMAGSGLVGTPKKTRVQIAFGSAVASLGWHQGASAEDIRETIRRRFGLAEGVEWAIVDADGDELVVSAAIPAGTYTLKVLSHADDAAAAAAAAEAAAEDAAAAAAAANSADMPTLM